MQSLRGMSERAEITCQDCYFRRAELCALPGNRVCPTFRMAKTALIPPRQPRLVARPPQRVPATAVA
jgi:hypothetical protein